MAFFRTVKGKKVFVWLNADGKERSKVVGPASMTKEQALIRVGELGLNKLAHTADPEHILFSEMAAKYIAYGRKIKDGTEKAETTKGNHTHLINDYLVPKFGDRVATKIKSSEIREFMDGLKLAAPSKAKIKTLMGTIFKYAKAYDLISEDYNPVRAVPQSAKSDWEAKDLKPEQTLLVLSYLPIMEHTLLFLIAATGLRISEALALKWKDLDAENNVIPVKATWVGNEMLQKTKSKASKRMVPYHPLLVEKMEAWRKESPYAGDEDYVFPSIKCSGKIPRSASIMVSDHLRPAAVKAGVIDGTEKRFGFHNFRHSLSTTLAKNGNDPKLIQTIMGHSKIDMTLHYIHAKHEERLDAQAQMLEKWSSATPMVQ